ncbi:hypothetical protein Purlil1_12399 [Purpureocillium lilacinum]|uniref:Uncharacterized protein n=1 Tax=Purpureocillium lilacinum TaxID=33203 RepID=A0ABR0BGY3_PURLI|nr:hypothetical protein Purlil1_12399 [Purpureocillium lilacinum]
MQTTKGRNRQPELAVQIIAKCGKPLRPVLASRVAATVHVSFATWLHGDGQFRRADHCGVAVAASSARAINIQTLTKVAMQGAKTDKGADMPLADVEPVPRCSRTEVGFLTSSDGISCCRVRRFLPSSLCLSSAATRHVTFSMLLHGGERPFSHEDVMRVPGPKSGWAYRKRACGRRARQLPSDHLVDYGTCSPVGCGCGNSTPWRQMVNFRDLIHNPLGLQFLEVLRMAAKPLALLVWFLKICQLCETLMQGPPADMKGKRDKSGPRGGKKRTSHL